MHPAIVQSRAVAAYSGWPAASLHRLKYDRERDRSLFIAQQMLPSLALLGASGILVPVPLHIDRQEWRGFNQSEAIAQHLGKMTGMTVEKALIRVKPTVSQTQLSREQRISNLAGAMEIATGWKADPATQYLLIDDVYTTGATSGACAEQLSRAGAVKISLVSFIFDLQLRDLEEYRHLVSAAMP